MHAFLAVANASKNKPRFIILEHNGDKDSEYRFGLVGKGLTYDAGGLSIKPTNSMVSMKSDMAGSAAVAGVFCALAKNNVKANVTGVIAACENLISGTGYRPGDIINSRQGKTIFIGNTDAEGRLTLVDAIDYIIKEENVNEVIDIATLTGAAVASLGNTRTALFSNNDEMASIIEKVAIENGEPMWRMPIDDDYRELVKHHEADLTNSAGQPGAITAAIFLEKFTLDKSWAHLDIAGPSFYDKESGYIKKGGTGVGVKTLYNYIQNKING
jgi:leucyl aminopeptidase